jgi:RHS repeat-associated protein
LIQKQTTTDGGTSTDYYVWGLDLSGTLQGAGGIGGLLAKTNSLTSETFLYTVDANGNVGQLMESSTGTIAAHYEYDPFGNLLVTTGPEAESNVFRFSTKYYDAEVGLYYYGYRYYSPELGRWMSRDPVGEQGFVLSSLQKFIQLDKKLQDYFDNRWTKRDYEHHVYQFVKNDPFNNLDFLGLLCVKKSLSSQNTVPFYCSRRDVLKHKFDSNNPACMLCWKLICPTEYPELTYTYDDQRYLKDVKGLELKAEEGVKIQSIPGISDKFPDDWQTREPRSGVYSVCIAVSSGAVLRDLGDVLNHLILEYECCGCDRNP